MRHTVTTTAAALLLAGCGALSPSVALRTDEVGCFAGGESGWTGPLVADAKLGVTFMGKQVVWPIGYTGRRAGSEVVVVDASGKSRAVTGRTYHISHAFAPSLGFGEVGAFVAAVDCGYPWDFVDCTANPTDAYCRPS